MQKFITRHYILLVLAAVVPQLAQSYVDPGSGHLVFQLLFAFVAGALFYFRTILDWVMGVKKESADEPEPEDRTSTVTTEMVRETFAAVGSGPKAKKRSSKPARAKKKSGSRKAPARKRA